VRGGPQLPLLRVVLQLDLQPVHDGPLLGDKLGRKCLRQHAPDRCAHATHLCAVEEPHNSRANQQPNHPQANGVAVSIANRLAFPQADYITHVAPELFADLETDVVADHIPFRQPVRETLCEPECVPDRLAEREPKCKPECEPNGNPNGEPQQEPDEAPLGKPERKSNSQANLEPHFSTHKPPERVADSPAHQLSDREPDEEPECVPECEPHQGAVFKPDGDTERITYTDPAHTRRQRFSVRRMPQGPL